MLHIQGYRTTRILNLNRKSNYTLTNEDLINCSTKEQFKSTLYSKFNNIIESDNIDTYTFDYDVSKGVSFRYGDAKFSDSYYNTPLLTTKFIKMPKKITIGLSYNSTSTSMVQFRIMIFNQDNIDNDIYILADGGYSTYGMIYLDSVTPYQPNVNDLNGTLIYTHPSATTLEKTTEINIPKDIPNTLARLNNPEYVQFKIYSVYQFTNFGASTPVYATNPCYVTQFSIEY